MSKIESFDEKRKALISLLDTIDSIDDKNISKAYNMSMELFENIIFKMLLENNTNTFFGYFIVKLNREIDFRLNACAAVYYNGSYFTIVINPFLFFKPQFNLTHNIAFIKHEVYHVVMKHISRAEKYNKIYNHSSMNIAMDVAINQFIPELPQGFFDLKTFCEKFKLDSNKVAKEETFEYYFDLIKKQNKIDPKNAFDKLIEELNKKTKQEMEDIIKELENNSKKVVKDFGGGLGHSKWEESDNDDGFDSHDEVVKQLLNDAFSKSRGVVPGAIESIIKELNKKPILKWQDIFKNFIGRVPVPYKKTITRTDRRQPKRLDLRGRLNDRRVDIILAMDTSGSVSDEDIRCYLNEIFAIVKGRNYNIDVIECDADVKEVYTIKKPNDIHLKVHGRGGTCFTPVFKYINDNINKYRNAVLVYFTDGYGERTLEVKPKHYKTLWIVNNKKCDLSLEEPFGIVKELNLDDLRKKYSNI